MDTSSIPIIEQLRRRTIRPPELIMLSVYFICGLHMMIGEPSSPVKDGMGDGFHQIWVGTLLVGPVIAISGVFCNNQYVGTWLRIGGGSSVAFSLGAFAAALVSSFLTVTMTSVLVFGLVLATLAAVIRDVRLLVAINKSAAREDHGLAQ